MVRHHGQLALLALALLATSVAGQTDELSLVTGDVYTGTFEAAGDGGLAQWQMRVHSPLHGSVEWMSALGSNPWYLSHCHAPGVNAGCAGIALERPISGALNVSSVAQCTRATCPAGPSRQPSSGCIPYGCRVVACGCTAQTPRGCTGKDFQGGVALIQRGMGIGEPRPVSPEQCTFDLKLRNAYHAGASAVIVFADSNARPIYMSSESDETVPIPAVFVSRDIGLRLWALVDEAMPQSVDVSLTNLEEHSLRVTVVAADAADTLVDALVEFRMSSNQPGSSVYGSYQAKGSRSGTGFTLAPSCTDPEPIVGQVCNPWMVDWVTRPDRWYYTGPGNPAPRNEIAPFGISGQLRKAGADGVAFEHYTGSVTEDASAKVRLRQLPACRPMVSHVFDCSAGDTATDEQGWRQRCEGALDDKGYRVFNDADFALTQPLQWYCAGKYCEGDSLTWDTVHLDLPTATVPAACPNGRRNKYLFLGEDDWGFDQSLHLCGYGTDRSAQHPACRRLPAGWFFNTSCSVSHWLNGESECGHAGWWMEGGYISSCTNAEDCAVDGSTSRLDLSINLPEEGLVSFIYTAHGEPFFDYMQFSINNVPSLRTRQWSNAGFTRKRFSQVLPPGPHILRWEWIKDESVSFADDRATIQQIVITGTGSDDASAGCDVCPTGSCGHGGIQGCAVCPVNRRSATTGAVECASCAMKPSASEFIPPAAWPFAGNTVTCSWRCSTGYYAAGQCSSGTTCPPGKCCAELGKCLLPSRAEVETGQTPASLQMLKSCVAMVPIDKPFAQKTIQTVTNLLGDRGAYALFDFPIRGNPGRSRGAHIQQASVKIFGDVMSAGNNAATGLPNFNDFETVHAPLMKALRDTGDMGLAYLPPRFYQSVSMSLPFHMGLGTDGPTGCVLPPCSQMVITSVTSEWKAGRTGTKICECETCDCPLSPSNTPSDPSYYVGFYVVGGVAMVQEWAESNSPGADLGAKVLSALASEAARGSSSSSGEQPGCTFARRTLGVCPMPECTGAKCHVRLTLRSRNGQETHVIDVPWMVSYDPPAQAAGLSCAEDAQGGSVAANVECMRQAVIGKAGDSPVEPDCTAEAQMGQDGVGISGMVNPAVFSGQAGPDRASYTGACLEDFDEKLPMFAPNSKSDTSEFLTVDNVFRSASGYVLSGGATAGQARRTGVISLRSFAKEEIALHGIVSDLVAAKVGSLLIDVRGNPGGSLCHAMEVAYLVSSHFASPQEAAARMGMYIRRTPLMDELVRLEDLADILDAGGVKDEGSWFSAASHLQFADVCSLRNFSTPDAKAGYCYSDVSDRDFYDCGDAPACNGPNAYLTACEACPARVKKVASAWSLPFRPRCAGIGTGGGSALVFPVGNPWLCGTSDRAQYLRTKKVWAGCSPDLPGGGPSCGFDRGSLTILTDARCSGACASFVHLLHSAGVATVVTPSTLHANASVPAPYADPASGILSSGSSLQCQKKFLAARNLSDPSGGSVLDASCLSMPAEGQEIFLPISAATFVGEFENAAGLAWEDENPRKDRITFYPTSVQAAKCLPNLYREVVQASDTCSISIMEMTSREELGDVQQNCSAPHATSSTRMCNSTCPDEKRVCGSAYMSKEAGECKPVCWSRCSALECEAGYSRVWVNDRHVCFIIYRDTLDDDMFQIGFASGRRMAEEKFAWRASLSPGGATLLIFLLMAFSSLSTLFFASRASSGGGEVKVPGSLGEVGSAAGSVAGAVVGALGAAGAAVASAGGAALEAVKGMMPTAESQASGEGFSISRMFGGRSAEEGDQVNLASSEETGEAGPDYRAL